MIPSLTFLAPAWLAAGAGAALLPVLAHVLSLRRPRRVEFPAARFVRAAQLATTRRTRPRDALLLSLRVLAILLIASAFADPVLRRAAPAAGPDAPQANDTIIVIDASASMQRLRGGIPLFELARERAQELLDRMDGSSDRASVILLSGRPSALLPRPTQNRSALRHALASAQPTLEFGDAQAALDAAAELTSHAGNQNARIVVFSDFQASQWTGARSSKPIDARILSSDDAAPGASVGAITLLPRHALPDSAGRLFASVTNHDSVERSIPVELSAPFGNSAAVLTLGPHQSGIATLDLASPPQGLAGVRVSVPADQFPFDDARYTTLDTRASSGDAIITAADTDDLSRGAAWIHAALIARSSSHSAASPTALPPRGLTGPDLIRFDALALVECGAIDDATISAIHERLLGGGDVVWFLDSPDSRGSLDRLLQRAGIASGMSSAATSRSPAQELTITRLAGADIPGDWLSAATIAAPIPLEVFDGAEILATLSDGSPLIVGTAVGPGRLSIVRAEVTPGASSLPSSGLLPALLDMLLRSESAREAPSAPIGVPFTVAFDTESASLPIATVDSLGRPVRLETQGATTLAHFEALQTRGLVSLFDAGNRAVAMRAVNLDSRESDTERLTGDQLRSLSIAGIDQTVAGLQVGAELEDSAFPLWPWLIALALVALGAESWFLWSQAPRRDQRAEVAR